MSTPASQPSETTQPNETLQGDEARPRRALLERYDEASQDDAVAIANPSWWQNTLDRRLPGHTFTPAGRKEAGKLDWKREWGGVWLSRVPLFGALALSLLALLATGLVVVLVTNGIGNQHWRLGIAPMTWAERVKYAAATVTAFGATVALVVNYRKQRDSEQGRFATSFADACAQLGGEAPAVRLGGVYALAALADRQSGRERRQQCIDALCAYLRLPYDPNTGNDHTTTSTVESADDDGVKTTITNTYRPADREVRLTIIRIIRDHLRDPDAPATWVGHPLDFTGAVFDGGDFTGAHFTADTSFENASFPTGNFSFREAKFSGAHVSFVETKFLGAHVSFYKVELSGGQLLFHGAKFSRGEIYFEQTELLSGALTFNLSEFSGSGISFRSANLRGTLVSFDTAYFSGGDVIFWYSTLEAGNMSFSTAVFMGGEIRFDGASFGKVMLYFLGTKFRNHPIVFSSERPSWFDDFMAGKVPVLSGDGNGHPVPFQRKQDGPAQADG